MNWTIFHQQIFPIRHKLYRFALRITGSVHEAEDVVQEVMERVWKSPEEQTAAVQNWEAWCMTMTRNRSLDKTRQQTQRRAAPIDHLIGYSADNPTPAQETESRDMTDRVRNLMQQLPEKQRLVMHLRDIEELSYEEIASVLDISLDQVKVSLHRARKSVREKLLNTEVVTPFNP